MISIFVTVGTTRFDDLIKKIFSSSFLKKAESINVDKLSVQYGKSIKPNQPSANISISAFEYTDKISSYFRDADIIIAHAGFCYLISKELEHS